MERGAQRLVHARRAGGKAGRLLLGLAFAHITVGWAQGQRSTGSIEGRVTFDGAAPAGTLVAESGSTQKVLHVNGGALQYAVVYLPDARPSGPASKTPATLDQRNFIFEPQLLAVRAGQPVQFTNSDSANHNVRSRDPIRANAFGLITAGSNTATHPQRFVATPLDRPVELSCDIHPWMVAWIYVFDHEEFAVTAVDGRFRIDNVPAGRHRVAVRQPSGRLARDVAVDVRAGETSHLDVRFTPSDVGMPTR